MPSFYHVGQPSSHPARPTKGNEHLPDLLQIDPVVTDARAGRHLMPRSLIILAFATALTPAVAQAPDKAKHMIEGVRNVRYCELIPVVRRGFRLSATVYNTLGLNDCPAEVWDKITEAAMKKRFGAIEVVLNSPRHFVMDTIMAAGDTASGATVGAGGRINEA
jgi:hypothetical protein